MTKKDFTKAESLPKKPSSEEVFKGLIEEDKPITPPNPITANNPRGAGRHKGSMTTEPHARFNVWLPVSMVEDAKAVAYAQKTKASTIMERAIEEYLKRPECVKAIKKYGIKD